ncbi:MAG: hypothetical protein ACREA2_10845 [Blastocatellia bacterium]
MTDEEISQMTREEAVAAFAATTSKGIGLEAAYRTLKLVLMQEAQNPDLTDDQRKLLSKILAEL